MILKFLLLPFSLLYQLVTSVRNFLFDAGWLKQAEVEPAVISVGNLRVGGTGKTPHVEYLVRLLKETSSVAVLSRGYGRKTKGFILANEQASAFTIGDEPFQFYSKFSSKIQVAVGEDRALAVPHILSEHPEVNTIILDDAYQHRGLARDLNILLTEYSKPFYRDFILPVGRLRESRVGASRADVVVVTKSPGKIIDEEKARIISEIRKYAGETPVFFTAIDYLKPIALFEGSFNENNRILLLSGLANPGLLEEQVRRNYKLEKHFIFPDHHIYSSKDIETIIRYFKNIPGDEKCILTTEKDMVKLLAPEIKEQLRGLPVFYQPISIRFLENKELFDRIVISKIKEKSESSAETNN